MAHGAGYSGTPLPKKLGIVDDVVFATVGAPPGSPRRSATSATAVWQHSLLAPLDVVVSFHTARAALARMWPKLVGGGAPRTGRRGWRGRRRRAACATDITEDVLREVLLPTGWVDNKVSAIDERWSGLRFVLRKRESERLPRRSSSGLIVGRFNPPHLGHSYMIDWAAQRVEQLVVFVNTRDGRARARARSAPSGWPSCTPTSPSSRSPRARHELRRRSAVGEVDGAVPVALAALDGPARDLQQRPLRRRARRAASAPKPVVVDAERTAVPISATQIREAPADHLDRLAPPVRAWVEANLV